MLAEFQPLVDIVDRYTLRRKPTDGLVYQTEIDHLAFMRTTEPTGPIHAVYDVSVCMTLRGAKDVTVGDVELDYHPGDYLVVGIAVPAIGRVIEASVQQPFIGLNLRLDRKMLLEMSSETSTRASSGVCTGLYVSKLDHHTTQAFGNLLALLDTPEAIPALYPLRARELYYWLARTQLPQLLFPNGHIHQVAEVVRHMKTTFPQPVTVDDLADVAGMSASSLHSHFRDVTGMTPIQYYKRLRLLEARRLIRGAETVTAQEVAYRVGYESPSQFSREYTRAFGATPARDRGGVAVGV